MSFANSKYNQLDIMALPTDLRKLIIKYHIERKSLREIRKIVKISLSTVLNIVNKHKIHHRIEDFPKTGRPRKLSSKQERLICRKVKSNSHCSAVKIAESISFESGSMESASTIRRTLNSNGLHGRTPRKKPFISKKNKTRRLNFAKEKVKCTEEFWNRTIFTDESKFEIFGGQRKQKIWRSK